MKWFWYQIAKIYWGKKTATEVFNAQTRTEAEQAVLRMRGAKL